MAGALTAAIAAAFSGVTPDDYFEYTTLLLPGNGTNGAQNNTFLDGSTNNFTITRNGNTTQGTFSPFSQTGWGNYFDGSGAGAGGALSFPANAAFSFSGDFTIEFWVYPLNNNNTSPSIFLMSLPGSTFLAINCQAGSYLSAFLNTASPAFTSTDQVPAVNAWSHVALVRSGSTVKFYVNGVASSSTATNSSTLGSSTVTPFITNSSNTTALYISNFRITNGQALYTTNFTPTTSPLTTTSQGATAGNVKLLTCQNNRFIDNSSNNFSVTLVNSPSVVAFSPFNPTASWSAATYGGSGYFDGNGDYLSVADNTNLRLGTNAFTIQAWVYRNASGAAHSIIAKGGASTGYVLQVTSTNVLRFTHGTTNVDTTTTIPAFAWTHVAAVRTNTSTNGFQLYINGVSSATATVATDFNQTDTLYIGSDRSAANVMNGYISGLKYTNGTAESISVPTNPPTATTNVALLTNFTNAGIYDATSKNDLETVGNAQISTTQSKWGGSSISFDGTGDYVTSNVSTSDLYTFGTGAFTVECWVYLNTTSGIQAFIDFRPVATNGPQIILYTNAGVLSFQHTSAVRIAGATLSAGQWYHVALARSGTDTKMFLNGTQTGSTYSGDTTSYNTGANRPVLGTDGAISTPPPINNLNGYLQDVRITKGYARYTSNFTAPTAAFPTL